MANAYYELTGNRILWIAVFSWFIAQLIKLLITILRKKTFDIRLLVGAGGMPSSHTSFVTAMTTSIGFAEGFNSSIFAVSAIISLIVMYDAAGVRRAAGKQAEVINMLVAGIEGHGINLDKKLKELLGHSPVEVGAGLILGITVGILFH